MSENGNRMWDEYKLLQGKVDNIGDFRFRIKSWAMTLLMGFVIGGFASKIPTIMYLTVLLPLMIMFHIFDRNQSIWLGAFTQRLRKIELVLRKENKTSSRSKFFTKDRRSPGVVSTVTQTINSKRRFSRWFAMNIHDLFYFILYFVIIGNVLLYVFFPQNKTNEIKENVSNSIIINQSSNESQVEKP